MKKVIFIDSNHPALEQLLVEDSIQCDMCYSDSYEQVLAKIQNYDGLVIRSRFKIGKEFLDKASKLRVIARAGAGMENIDVNYAESRGIKCLHAPEGNKDALAEHALGMLLCLMNNICKANNQVRIGRWIREANRGSEIMGKTVGIIGYGNMGEAFAERLTSFSCKLLVYDKYKTGYGNDTIIESDLESIFNEADIVSMHVPLTEETKFMCNSNFFSSFRKPFYFINTSRGKVAKTDDLVIALQNNAIKGACLDVLEFEDSSFEAIESQDNTTLNYLLQSERVIITPHIAGWTHESNQKIATSLAKKIISALNCY